MQNLQRVDHLSSSMPDSLFLSMKELYFRGNNSFVNLRVRGTARLPSEWMLTHAVRIGLCPQALVGTLV